MADDMGWGDPGEKKDLAAEKPEIAQAMKQTFLQWRHSCKRSLEGKDYPRR